MRVRRSSLVLDCVKLVVCMGHTNGLYVSLHNQRAYIIIGNVHGTASWYAGSNPARLVFWRYDESHQARWYLRALQQQVRGYRRGLRRRHAPPRPLPHLCSWVQGEGRDVDHQR